ncbi:MAG: hypothetical protein AAGD17_07980 [Bacteroidota bacterium]
MIAFWTIVILAALGLVYIWFRLIKMIFPSRSLEIESNPYTRPYGQENNSKTLSFWKKVIRSLYP